MIPWGLLKYPRFMFLYYKLGLGLGVKIYRKMNIFGGMGIFVDII